MFQQLRKTLCKINILVDFLNNTSTFKNKLLKLGFFNAWSNHMILFQEEVKKKVSEFYLYKMTILSTFR